MSNQTTTPAPTLLWWDAIFFVRATLTDTSLLSQLRTLLGLAANSSMITVVASPLPAWNNASATRNVTLGFSTADLRDDAVYRANRGAVANVLSAAAINDPQPAVAESSSNTGAIVGGVVGGLVAVAVVVIVVKVFVLAPSAAGTKAGTSSATSVRFDDDFVMAQGAGDMKSMEAMLLEAEELQMMGADHAPPTAIL